MVDPIVRDQRWRPPVMIFILARTTELTHSPTRNAVSEAATIRHELEKTVSQACWFGQAGAAGGRARMTQVMKVAKTRAENPAQITFRDRA